tara:strand:+ start:6846 stop:7253 length:408 start_codon:yes stop_codon:yes gene_type:complete
MDGDYSYTRIDLKNGNKKEDWNAWCIIHDSYLDEFGSSQQEKEIFEIRKRLALLECDFVINDDQYLRNQIRRLQNELLELMVNSIEGGSSRDGLIVQLEKWMGFRLDENEISARKFYSVVREFEKEIAMMKKVHS